MGAELEFRAKDWQETALRISGPCKDLSEFLEQNTSILIQDARKQQDRIQHQFVPIYSYQEPAVEKLHAQEPPQCHATQEPEPRIPVSPISRAMPITYFPARKHLLPEKPILPTHENPPEHTITPTMADTVADPQQKEIDPSATTIREPSAIYSSTSSWKPPLQSFYHFFKKRNKIDSDLLFEGYISIYFSSHHT